MKIAYLTNQYPSISHSFIRREIEALERRGVSIARFTIRSSEHGAISEEDRCEAEKTRCIIDAGAPEILSAAAASLFSRPARSVRAFLRAMRMGLKSEAGVLRHFFYAVEALVLASWLRKEDCQHLHVHFGTNSASVAMLAAFINDDAFSMTVHGPEEFDKPALIHLPEKIKSARLVFAVSSYGVSQLRRLVEPEYWDRIRIAPCGVERAFHSDPAPAPATARFVCVGRLCEQKGQLTLVEAAAEARRRGANFVINLVGDGDMRNDLEAAIARHKLGDAVRLLGWRTPAEVRREIENATALVLPSYAEGLPVSIMEAMLLGRPVISTYVAGIPELVLPGENGWLAPAGDAGALCNAMLAAAAAGPERLEEMGRAARDRALARHDIDKIAALIETYFSEAIEAGAVR
ncbi:MAG: glycosyltransferase [Parvularculaceae bacterium]|nr:glycosyltransferase [Parvularculaceae bacterium]